MIGYITLQFIFDLINFQDIILYRVYLSFSCVFLISTIFSFAILKDACLPFYLSVNVVITLDCSWLTEKKCSLPNIELSLNTP